MGRAECCYRSAADAWDIYVSAHDYNGRGVRRAVDLGVRSIEHANLIDRDTLEHLSKHDLRLSLQVMGFQ
ncbi:MAG: hypothetical protein AB8B57_03000 [Congregibacter sp.]